MSERSLERRRTWITRRGLPGLVLALTVNGAARAQMAPPAALPLEPIEFPAYTERTLSNGAELLVVTHDEQPFVTVSVYIRAGTAADPRNRVGVAGMVSALLTQGTETRTAREIADAIDFLGGTLGASASADWTSVTLGVLSPDLDAGLDLLADVVMRPSFPEAEVELVRTRALTGLQFQQSQAGYLAGRELTRAVYGNHPYGKVDTPESIRAISRNDLVTFHERHYNPSNALVVVAGDVEPDDLAARLESAFFGWSRGSNRGPTYFAPPELEQNQVVLVHKPGSVQSAIRVGHLLPKADHEDWTALQVGVEVLGGGSSGRLFQTLREDRGWTYGAYAETSRRLDFGIFEANAEVRTEVTDSAVAELLYQIERMRTEIVSGDDLQDVKDFLVGSFPLGIETPQQIAGQVASYRLRGRSTEDLISYRDRVAEVDAVDVRDASARHLLPDRSVIVVVGDATELRPGLTRFGPVRMVDTEGNPLTVDDIEVVASDATYDPSVLQPGTWTYDVNVQGRQAGRLTRSLVRTEVDGRRAISVKSSMSLAQVNQISEVAFTERDFRPISNVSKATTPRGEASVELRFEGGRVKGTRSSPQGETESFERDVVTGALVGEMQELVVWLSDLEAGQELRFPAVNAQNGSTTNVTVKVKGQTEITVPAGTFPVFELELSGGGQNQRAFALVESPHLIVKSEFLGRPIVVELRSMR